MMAKIWTAIATQADDVIQMLRRFSPAIEPSTAYAANPKIPPLELPQRPDVLTLLFCGALPHDLVTHYAKCFNETVDRMEAFLNAQYVDKVSRACTQDTFDLGADTSYVQALRNGFIALYHQHVEQALAGLQSHINARESSTKTPPSSLSALTPSTSPRATELRQTRRGRPHIFSKEQKAVLQALLAHDDQYSTEEKELIAQTLNLTREQVNRWFCNARARGGRKRPYEKPLPRAQREALKQRANSVASSDVSENTQSSSSLASSDDTEVNMLPPNFLNDGSGQSSFLSSAISPLLFNNDIPHAARYSPSPSSSLSLSLDSDSVPSSSTDAFLSNPLYSSDSSSSKSTCSSNGSIVPDDLSMFFGSEFTDDSSPQYDESFGLGFPAPDHSAAFSDDPTCFLQTQLPLQQNTPHEYWQGLWTQL